MFPEHTQKSKEALVQAGIPISKYRHRLLLQTGNKWRPQAAPDVTYFGLAPAIDAKGAAHRDIHSFQDYNDLCIEDMQCRSRQDFYPLDATAYFYPLEAKSVGGKTFFLHKVLPKKTPFYVNGEFHSHTFDHVTGVASGTCKNWSGPVTLQNKTAYFREHHWSVYGMDPSSPVNGCCVVCVDREIMGEPQAPNIAQDVDESVFSGGSTDNFHWKHFGQNTHDLFLQKRALKKTILNDAKFRLLVSGVGAGRVGFSVACAGCPGCAGGPVNGGPCESKRVAAAAKGDVYVGSFGNEILQLVFYYLYGYTRVYVSGVGQPQKQRINAHIRLIGLSAVRQHCPVNQSPVPFQIIVRRVNAIGGGGQLTRYWPTKQFGDFLQPMHLRTNWFGNLESVGDSTTLTETTGKIGNKKIRRFVYKNTNVPNTKNEIMIKNIFIRGNIDLYYLNKMERDAVGVCRCGPAFVCIPGYVHNLQENAALPRFCKICGKGKFVSDGTQIPTTENDIREELLDVWDTFYTEKRCFFSDPVYDDDDEVFL